MWWLIMSITVKRILSNGKKKTHIIHNVRIFTYELYCHLNINVNIMSVKYIIYDLRVTIIFLSDDNL